MVGSKSTPAIRHLRPVLKKSGSMPKLLGQHQPRNTKDRYHKPKLAGQPTAVLEQVSRAMAQQARAETMQVEARHPNCVANAPLVRKLRKYEVACHCW
eukprot:s2993_g12.t1